MRKHKEVVSFSQQLLQFFFREDRCTAADIHMHTHTQPTTGRYKERGREKRKRGQRYREIKGKLMSSVWICGPGLGVFQGVFECVQ